MRFLVLLLFGIVLFGCLNTSPPLQGTPSGSENVVRGASEENLTPVVESTEPVEVEFETSDGLLIYGVFYPSSSQSENVVILLHMLAHDSSSYSSFARQLQSVGFNALALDLRGHGNSKNGLSWETMADEDFRNIEKDVDAAVNYLKTERGLNDKIFLIGASIGSNTVINYGSSHEVTGVVALSPSWNYRGIDTTSSTSIILVPVLIASSQGDDTYSEARDLYNVISSQKEFIDQQGNAHGTDLLPAIENRIINWLKLH